MKYEFKTSFVRSLKSLQEKDKNEIKHLTFQIVNLISTGKPPSKGCGLTRLRKDYWEARANINQRIIFKLTKDYISFILVGNHDGVKRFLKTL